jgi:hypothetical protein
MENTCADYSGQLEQAYVKCNGVLNYITTLFQLQTHVPYLFINLFMPPLSTKYLALCLNEINSIETAPCCS